jgi:hypothetical protein
MLSSLIESGVLGLSIGRVLFIITGVLRLCLSVWALNVLEGPGQLGFGLVQHG